MNQTKRDICPLLNQEETYGAGLSNSSIGTRPKKVINKHFDSFTPIVETNLSIADTLFGVNAAKKKEGKFDNVKSEKKPPVVKRVKIGNPLALLEGRLNRDPHGIPDQKKEIEYIIVNTTTEGLKKTMLKSIIPEGASDEEVKTIYRAFLEKMVASGHVFDHQRDIRRTNALLRLNEVTETKKNEFATLIELSSSELLDKARALKRFELFSKTLETSVRVGSIKGRNPSFTNRYDSSYQTVA